MLFAATNTDATTPNISAYPSDVSNANARINLNPSPQHVDTDGRAFGDILLTIDLASIGMPGDGYIVLD